MKTLIYILQVSACTGLFYSFYYLLLRRYTFFTLNRWYLLATLIISFIIPAVHIPVFVPKEAFDLRPLVYMQQIHSLQTVASTTSNTVVDEPGIDWIRIIELAYTAIAFLLLVHFLVVLCLIGLKLRNKKLGQIGAVKVLKGDKAINNSSFLNVIFINDDELKADEVKQVLAHELLHIQLLHSADRIIAWLARIVLWFNPFIYGYVRSIEENHEFEVDHMAAGGGEKKTYASLLLKLTASHQSTLFQSFSKAPLQKRITMLFNQPTNHMKKLIYVLVLPLLVLSGLAFSNFKFKVTELQTGKEKKKAAPDTTTQYWQKVKRTPQQIEGHKSFMKWMKSADYQAKVKLSAKLRNEVATYKVIGSIKSNNVFLRQGTLVQRNGQNFVLGDYFGKDKDVHGLLKPGDIIEVKPSSVLFGKQKLLVIQASYIKKDNEIIYQATPEPPANYAFLYEANKVRFADGVVRQLEKYADGKWKSAVITSNGYQLRLNLKPSAPAFDGIEEGDRVRFRFVHEIKTGAKEYTVEDWVALSSDVKDYGVKNPDFFFKYYEKI